MVPHALGDEKYLKLIATTRVISPTLTNHVSTQDGISHPRDRRWQSTFEQMFHSKQLTDIYWYNVLGNHDWKANMPHNVKSQFRPALASRTPLEETLKSVLGAGVGAQVAHTFYDPRWCMPGLNYTVTVPVGQGVDLKLVVFDTQVLVRADPGDDPSDAENVYRSSGIPTADEMLEWLEGELCAKPTTAGNAQWLMTVGHHFVVSAGNYFANPEVDIMFHKVAPLFKRCGVHVYFHGHDHVSQVLRLPGGTLQVGVGSAGKDNGAVKGRQADFERVYGRGKYKVEFASVKPAIASVAVSPEKIQVELWGPGVKSTQPLFRGEVLR
jgi:hypothetical protein